MRVCGHSIVVVNAANVHHPGATFLVATHYTPRRRRPLSIEKWRRLLHEERNCRQITHRPLSCTGFPYLPLLRVVEPVTPQLLHYLVFGNAKLGRVYLGKLVQREAPLVET